MLIYVVVLQIVLKIISLGHFRTHVRTNFKHFLLKEFNKKETFSSVCRYIFALGFSGSFSNRIKLQIFINFKIFLFFEDNYFIIQSMIKRFSLLIVTNAFFSVDSFFLLRYSRYFLFGVPLILA